MNNNLPPTRPAPLRMNWHYSVYLAPQIKKNTWRLKWVQSGGVRLTSSEFDMNFKEEEKEFVCQQIIAEMAFESYLPWRHLYPGEK